MLYLSADRNKFINICVELTLHRNSLNPCKSRHETRKFRILSVTWLTDESERSKLVMVYYRTDDYRQHREKEYQVYTHHQERTPAVHQMQLLHPIQVA